VPGRAKLIIWAANTKAPATPIRGTRLSSARRSSLTEDRTISPPEAAQRPAPTAGESSASAMCMAAPEYYESAS
jgi:hypothetical protein